MLKFPCHLPKLMLKLNKVKFGKKLRLIGWPFIFKFSNAKISIGNSVTINSNFWSNLLGLYQRTIIVAKKKGEITIGDRVGISGAAIYAWEKIEIGEKTLIGTNSVPSKTWSIMSAKSPVLACFDSDSDLCDIVRETSCGVCVEPDDVDGLVNAIVTLSKNTEENLKMGDNGRKYILENLTKELGTSGYIKVLKSITY